MRMDFPDVLSLALFPFVCLWFLMLAMFWRRLASHHPATYEALGSPHFLKPLGLFSTLAFLVARIHRKLGDRTLGRIADGALVVLLVCICGFALLIAVTGVFR